MGGERGRMPRLDGTGALDPPGRARCDKRTRAGIDERRGAHGIAHGLKVGDVHVASLFTAGKRCFGRLELSRRRIPAHEDVAGSRRGRKGNLGAAIGKNAARPHGSAFRRTRERQAYGIDGRKGRRDGAAPALAARLCHHRGLVLGTCQVPVDVPAPEQIARTGLGRKMKRLAQFEFVGRGFYHGPVARYRTAEP